MKTTIMMLVFPALVFGEVSDSSALDIRRLPGWYPTKLKCQLSNEPEFEKNRVKQLYEEMFPGALNHGADLIEWDNSGKGQKDGCLGYTTSQEDPGRKDSFQPIGGNKNIITVEIYDNNPASLMDTLRHELAHAQDYSIKTNGGRGRAIRCMSFYEEGQAVCVSWILNPALAQTYDSERLKAVYIELGDEEHFKELVNQKMFQGGPLEGKNYPVAGLFAMHVLSIAGPQAMKSLLLYENPETCLKSLKQDLAAKGMTFDQFLHTVYENGGEWIRIHDNPKGLYDPDCDPRIKKSAFDAKVDTNLYTPSSYYNEPK
jgi:hypothetical protein